MTEKKNINPITKGLLYPFSILYNSVTRLRNHLYSSGIKRSFHFDTVTISVGNLTVGGTGKTPHVEYLIRLLRNQYKIATLSRGYGRKTKGFIIADQSSTPTQIGDEPMQFYYKFSDEIVVSVGEERILAIPEILYQRPETNIIILDDAYQHRKVDPDLNILLCDYNLPFYNDVLLPAGRLRESRYGAARADIIIVSKCPSDLDKETREFIKKSISSYSGQQTPIFFTGINYGMPSPFFNNDILKGKALLVSGIARSEGLEDFVKSKYNFYKHLKFKDHHHYSKEDFISIRDEFDKMGGGDKVILITEKDMVKWNNEEAKKIFEQTPVFYLPIEVNFLIDGDAFNELIFAKIKDRLNELESR